MKLLALIFLLGSCVLFAQSIPLKRVSLGRVERLEPFVLIESDSAYYAYFDKKKETELPKIDFEKEILIGTSNFVDCQAKMFYEMRLNSDSLAYIFNIRSCYGGCRGMTQKGGWFVCKKPPANYEVKVSPAFQDRSIFSNDRRINLSADLKDWETPYGPCLGRFFHGIVIDSLYDHLDLNQSLEEYLISYEKLKLNGVWELHKQDGQLVDGNRRKKIRFWIDSGGSSKYRMENGKIEGSFLISLPGVDPIIKTTGKTLWKTSRAYFGVADNELMIWPITKGVEMSFSDPIPYVFRRIR